MANKNEQSLRGIAGISPRSDLPSFAVSLGVLGRPSHALAEQMETESSAIHGSENGRWPNLGMKLLLVQQIEKRDFEVGKKGIGERCVQFAGALQNIVQLGLGNSN